MQRVDADRRHSRPRTSSAEPQSSRTYVGATPLTHFHTITANLKFRRISQVGLRLSAHFVRTQKEKQRQAYIEKNFQANRARVLRRAAVSRRHSNVIHKISHL